MMVWLGLAMLSLEVVIGSILGVLAWLLFRAVSRIDFERLGKIQATEPDDMPEVAAEQQAVLQRHVGLMRHKPNAVSEARMVEIEEEEKTRRARRQ